MRLCCIQGGSLLRLEIEFGTWEVGVRDDGVVRMTIVLSERLREGRIVAF